MSPYQDQVIQETLDQYDIQALCKSDCV